MDLTHSAPKTIAILDFGSQYVQLIARRVREQHVHSVIVRPEVTVEELRELNTVGLILSGGPNSVYEASSPKCRKEVLNIGLPVLGICYGMQLLAEFFGGRVKHGKHREFGRTKLTLVGRDAFFHHIPEVTPVWMSHGDVVTELSEGFVALATTETCPFAAVRHREKSIYGVQFHPEVTHTVCGNQLIRNFLYDVCGCTADWQVSHVIQSAVEAVRARVDSGSRVICALSGGVDSSVAAALIHQAIGDRLSCIFVDNGLMRNRERELVEMTFRENFHIDLHVVEAEERFLRRLEDVVDPQQKRRIIGHEFTEVFKAEASKYDDARYLAQGTLYPDVIESGHSVGGHAANIKIHHNVGGLPAELGFELIEPLRDLFKDEVRRVGEHLGLPEEIVWRHPFPGPGLAVRVVGAVTKERLKILRQADDILLEEIRAAGWYRKIAQAFAVLLPIRSVGVMGDGRSYEDQHVVTLRLVESTDFMTADWVQVDYNLLARVSSRIMNEVRGVNRVVYDISTKPPSTIEWE